MAKGGGLGRLAASTGIKRAGSAAKYDGHPVGTVFGTGGGTANASASQTQGGKLPGKLTASGNAQNSGAPAPGYVKPHAPKTGKALAGLAATVTKGQNGK